MRRQIFIHLGELSAINQIEPPQVSWVVQEPGKAPGPVFYGDLATASNHATGCRVIVFVSAFDIVLVDVALPAMNRQRMAKAVPFALEEQVAEDVEDLHFAIGNRYGDVSACAIVQREALDGWLRALKDCSIQADVITTECFGVEKQEHAWVALINKAAGANHKVLVRKGGQNGLAMDFINTAMLLRGELERIEESEDFPNTLTIRICKDNMRRQTLISIEESENTGGEEDAAQIARSHAVDPADDKYIEFLEDEANPESGTVIAGKQSDDTISAGVNNTVSEGNKADTMQAVAPLPVDLGQELSPGAVQEFVAGAQSLCDELGIELQVKESEQAYLGILAQGYVENESINLLQGEYSRAEQLEKLIRPWWGAIAVAATWLLLQAGLFIAEYQHLKNEEEYLRRQIIATYKDAFPDAKNIPNPKVQMQRALEKLRGGDGQSVDMFTLLAKTGEVLKDVESVNLRSIRYKGDQIDIDLEISDLAALDDLKLRLNKEAELQVEIVSASARKGKVESRLQVQLGATS